MPNYLLARFDLPTSLQLTLAIIQFYTTANALTKISILLFYQRLTAGTILPLYRRILQAAIASIIAYWFAFTIALFAGCTPFSAFWRQIDPLWKVDWNCVDEPAVIIAASITSIVQDFMCCFMPVILFWELQISRRRKLGLMAIFGVGFWYVLLVLVRVCGT